MFRLGQSKGLSLQHLTSKEIEEKLSELLNHEIIDPVLRVWRVYRFVSKKPECDRYLVCSINRKGQYPDSKTGLKPGVTKLSRYVVVFARSASGLVFLHNNFLFLSGLGEIHYMSMVRGLADACENVWRLSGNLRENDSLVLFAITLWISFLQTETNFEKLRCTYPWKIISPIKCWVYYHSYIC